MQEPSSGLVEASHSEASRTGARNEQQGEHRLSVGGIAPCVMSASPWVRVSLVHLLVLRFDIQLQGEGGEALAHVRRCYVGNITVRRVLCGQREEYSF